MIRKQCIIMALAAALVPVSASGDAEAGRRLDLERKYPDIQFSWPRTPAEQPAAAGIGRELEFGETVMPPAPGVSIAPADAALIAEEEVLLRQKQRRGYTLGPGDVISINVRDHPEFSTPAVRVGYAGEVILPLTNEVVYADGLTVEEVRLQIEDLLKAYIEQPFVSVFITEFNSKKFYMLGEIGAGIYPIGDASIQLMDALYAAGLPSEGIAAMRRVQIITPHETRPINRWVNVYAILYKGRMEHNITIEPGTIIYVPTTIFTKMSRLIRQISVTIEDLSKIPNDLASFDAGLIAWDQSWNMNIFPKGIDLHGRK
ncbi:MAG: polysaccharide biosynthesis/export family protein [bacterium]|nr:polysaccharide biosynthesis/export family protein [bacterium]